MKKSGNKRLDFLPNIHNKYSIRKFTVGTASILLGTTLLFGASRDAEAAETDAQQAEEPAEHGADQAAPAEAPVVNQETQTQQTTPEVSTAQPANESNQAAATSEAKPSDNTAQVAPTNKEGVQAEKVEKAEATSQTESTPKADTTTKETAPSPSNEVKTTETAQVNTVPESTVDYSSLNDGAKAPVEFVEQYLHSSDKEGLVRNLLSETYKAQDVNGILSKLNVDYNAVSAEDLFQDILRAGIEYANEQTSKYTVYAVRAAADDPNAPTEGEISAPTTSRVGDPNTSSNIDIPVNSSAPEAIGALKASASIDPERGIIITGYGKTFMGQKPAHYIVTAKPDRVNNKMDFEIKYYATAGTGQTHSIDLGGFRFGDAFQLPSNEDGIPAIVQMVGTTGNPTTSVLKEGLAKPGYPEGYALNGRPFLNDTAIRNNGYADVKFSLPVKNWNGDLSVDGFVMMFPNGSNYSSTPDPYSTANYFNEKMEIVLDGNVDFNIRQEDQKIQEAIPFTKEYRTSTKIPAGTQRVARQGVNGVKEITSTNWYYKNVQLGNTVKTETKIKDEIPEIIELGVAAPADAANSFILPPVVDPKLSGETVVTGETMPYAPVTITVGLTTYQTTSDAQGKFTQTLATPLKQGEVISAITAKDGNTSLPGKTIVPRDGNTPELAYSSLKTEQNGKPGTLVTITNKATGEKLGEFFVADGTSVTVKYTQRLPNGDTKVTFSDNNSVSVPKGDPGDRGPVGPMGDSITVKSQTKLPNGDTLVTFTDGKTVTIPKGDKGDSIRVVATPESDLGTTIEFSDGSSIFIPKGEKGEAGRDGRNGRDGRPGTSITVVSIDDLPNGDKQVTFSDGNTVEIPKGDKGNTGAQGAKGDKGETGATGAAGKDAAPLTVTGETKDVAGNTVVHFSDGSQATISKGDKGDTGATGAQGAKGEDGKSITITSTEPQANGDIKVNFSDGKSIVVPKGAKGDKGEDAAPLTVVNETKDAAGNTVVHFSDGKTATISKGDKGDTGAQGQVHKARKVTQAQQEPQVKTLHH